MKKELRKEGEELSRTSTNPMNSSTVSDCPAGPGGDQQQPEPAHVEESKQLATPVKIKREPGFSDPQPEASKVNADGFGGPCQMDVNGFERYKDV